MTKHRHSQGEILHKLQQAEHMVAEGKSQRDIASALNVSVMTYHRWRKAGPTEPGEADVALDVQDKISELKIENLRLRKLVTDLLLEKMKLEEETVGSPRPLSGNGHAFHGTSVAKT